MTSHNNILIAYKSVCIYYFKSEIFLLEIPPKLKIEGDERRKKKEAYCCKINRLIASLRI